jgi:hypothetical protein
MRKHGKGNGKHPATAELNGQTPANDTTALTAATNESAVCIAWDDAVAEGKAILAKIVEAERSPYRLGELADKVVPKYGEETLAEYAKAIGENAKRLEEYRSVWRAWDGSGIFAPGQTSFAVLKELMAVGHRLALVTVNPKMTKRQAEVQRVIKDHPRRADIIADNPPRNHQSAQ